MLPTVRALYDDYISVLGYLRDQKEISYANAIGSSFPKVLLLASASHLEHELQELITEYFREVTGNHEYAVSFVRKKAISRQYHTYFAWDSGNANQFLSLFGDNFKLVVSSLLREDAELAQAIRDFVNLGALRNRLVHQNYATFTMENTTEEIWQMYENALKFIERLSTLLRQQI
jgi:hypothetical protein